MIQKLKAATPRMNQLFAPLFVACALGTGCINTTLEHEPYANIGKGSHQFAASTGWAFYEANVAAKGRSGILGSPPELGQDDTDLVPKYGGALKYSYFLTDNFSLGGIFELRVFDPDPVSPLSAELSTDEFQTLHFLGSARYFMDPLSKWPRLRPFMGVDIGYIPNVDFDTVTVDYPVSSGIPSEQISVEGSEFWTIAPVIGASYQLTDNMTFDFGAFYEIPLTKSEDTLTFQNLGGATADVKVEPEGLILFGGVSLFF